LRNEGARTLQGVCADVRAKLRPSGGELLTTRPGE
jgi:hypothetical protein